MNFDEICDDVKLNIEKLKTRHHIVVIVHANHQLVLDQFFLTDLSANYDYRFDEVYIVFINFDLNRFVIFKIFDRHDSANRTEKDVRVLPFDPDYQGTGLNPIREGLASIFHKSLFCTIDFLLFFSKSIFSVISTS
jgi:hypothetical protein